MINKYILFTFLLLVLAGYTSAQDITKVAKSKPVSITGGLSANTSLYESWGMESRQDPYFWQVVANLNFNFWGVVNMPFSAYFAKENTRYQQPSFKQFGLSPRYKSVTLHLGYRNMSFSPYSLAGLTFLGAGIEYQPQNSWIKASAMYGRFFKAVPASDSTQNHFQDPSYERWGGGFSVTASHKKNEVTLIMFKAADKPGSIPDPPAQYGITPAENLVIGVATKAQVIPQVFASVQYTISAYTSDTRTAEKDLERYSYFNNFGSLFTPRFSSTIDKAIETTLNYQNGSFTAGVTYKRIDPGYVSMGSTFIENDLEDMLLNMSKSFIKNKLTFSGSIGQQHNNLDKNKQTENKRVIGSMNAALAISQSLNVNANYSNFTSNTLPTLINFNDSVKYFQINKNTSINVNYNKGTETLRHSMNLMVAVQEATSLNRSATQSLQTNNNMINTSFSYQAAWPKKGLATTLSVQNSLFKSELITTRTYGPNVTLNKDLFKNKLKLVLSYSYSLTRMNVDSNNSNTQVVRFNTDFQVEKHQSLRFQTSYMRRSNAGTTGTLAPRELQSSLAYQYTF